MTDVYVDRDGTPHVLGSPEDLARMIVREDAARVVELPAARLERVAKRAAMAWHLSGADPSVYDAEWLWTRLSECQRQLWRAVARVATEEAGR